MVTTTSPLCSNYVNLSPSSCSFSTSTSELTLLAVVSSDQVAGKIFEFTVNSIKNPYNSKPKSGFTVQTMDSNDGIIDRGYPTLTVTSPASFSFLFL
jgi:hypothetical protein